MLNRRAPRLLVAGLLVAVTGSALAGCRTSPTVAAYVGEETVSVTELEDAVDARVDDPLIAAYAAGRADDFTRRVLGLLVEEEIYETAAQRYDVEVSDAAVRARIDELLGGQDPAAAYEQLAQEGLSEEDVQENIRQQLVRQRLAVAEGRVEQPTEEELRARYEQVRESLARIELGFLTVPDQATADEVLAQLTADPGSYAALAEQYAGPTTLPEVEARTLQEIPAALAEQVAAAEPGTGFILPVEGVGEVVGWVAGVVYPPFEEIRPQLEQEFLQAADQAGAELVEAVREDLEITVNPRFGQLAETGELVPADGGVVDILGDEQE